MFERKMVTIDVLVFAHEHSKREVARRLESQGEIVNYFVNESMGFNRSEVAETNAYILRIATSKAGSLEKVDGVTDCIYNPIVIGGKRYNSHLLRAVHTWNRYLETQHWT